MKLKDLQYRLESYKYKAEQLENQNKEHAGLMQKQLEAE